MTSLYRNGGMIGTTLDYANTDRYVLGTETVRGTISYVGGRTQTSTSTAAITVSLTGLTGGLATAPIEGDLVVVVRALAAGAATDVDLTTSSTGWTELVDLYSNDNRSTNLAIYYKRMGATPDTSIVLSAHASGQSSGFAVQVFRGVDAGTPFDVTSTTATASDTVLPNPPAITPTTQNALILIAGGAAHDDQTDTFGASYLTNFLSAGSSTSFDATVGMGYVSWTSGTYDPAAWTFSGTDTLSYSNASVTMALRPALVDVPILGNQKNSGIWTLEAISDRRNIDNQGEQEYISASGAFTFTVPANVTQISAVVIGGGGGGSGGESGRNEGMGGGGGGGLSWGTFAVTPGETLNINVGAGGTSSQGNSGGNGGASTIVRGATTLLSGGGGGGGPFRSTSGGTAGTSTGTERDGGGSGGAGGGASGNDAGGGGGGAGGYSGNGGAGSGTGTGSNAAVGSGGGGGGSYTFRGQGFGGGGVGVYGAGATGTGGINTNILLTVTGITSVVYNGLAGTNITGTGTGATFNVTKLSTTYTVTIAGGGTGYAVGNQIRILGTAVGGATTANDVTITVSTVSAGVITAVTVAGTSAGGAINAATRIGLTANAVTAFAISSSTPGVVVTNVSGGTAPAAGWTAIIDGIPGSGPGISFSNTANFANNDTIFIPASAWAQPEPTATGGSGGGNGSNTAAGLFGAGGGAQDDDTSAAGLTGGRGAVRIVWGREYSYPSNAPSGITTATYNKGVRYIRSLT